MMEAFKMPLPADVEEAIENGKVTAREIMAQIRAYEAQFSAEREAIMSCRRSERDEIRAIRYAQDHLYIQTRALHLAYDRTMRSIAALEATQPLAFIVTANEALPCL